ncbi:nucleoside hydrolase-like domain-containing protein [Flammeovirga sp. OC4]|uniref:nucleoside hydrolase-like domain-containing protein n=1 Tax=Flammeovirga sp. OC4 TaxID=1382345 RepID=UPI0005C64F1D|nr:nucleoside hydrolase-like domain-containing protein [Flammeovirga sp. OC4]
MKRKYVYIVSIFLLLIQTGCTSVKGGAGDLVTEKPRVIITTDIYNADFSMKDEQALTYLMWYLNKVTVQGVVLDRYNAFGVNKVKEIFQCYEKDFFNDSFSFNKQQFQLPDSLKVSLQKDRDTGVQKIIEEARSQNDTPLYVLILGTMEVVKEALLLAPDISDNIRLISIGTGVKPPDEDVCGNLNWNGWGRTEVFERFTKLWWIENDWAYKGLSEGNEPQRIYNGIIKYGELGDFISKSEKTRFNLEGAIPIMFLVDPQIKHNYPEFGGWTGNYIKPFPVERPHYWVDRADTKQWDYQYPCKSWDLAFQVLNERKQNVLLRRDQMYSSLMDQLSQLYSL